MNLLRRCSAEAIGTALLLAVIVGSGIMGERLAPGQGALALLANSVATGAGLAALILGFSEISGAHFNPVVTLSAALRSTLPWGEVPAYLMAQLSGAMIGEALAHAMFELPWFSASQHIRAGMAQGLSEFVATFGLMVVIIGCARAKQSALAFAVGAYIAAAYWFTASTAFANPAVTLARAASDTFSGIRPSDAPLFIVAQVLGAVTATYYFRWLQKAELKQ